MDCYGLKLVLYRYTTHLVSSSKDHSLQFQILYRPSTSFSIQHTPLPFLRYNPFPISICTPVLASPDKAPTPDAGKQFLLGMESIRLTLVKIHLRYSCCRLITFLTFFCHAFLFFLCLH